MLTELPLFCVVNYLTPVEPTYDSGFSKDEPVPMCTNKT